MEMCSDISVQELVAFLCTLAIAYTKNITKSVNCLRLSCVNCDVDVDNFVCNQTYVMFKSNIYVHVKIRANPVSASGLTSRHPTLTIPKNPPATRLTYELSQTVYK